MPIDLIGRIELNEYQSSNLRDFRHSDNINVFFRFVRDVGLPEVC